MGTILTQAQLENRKAEARKDEIRQNVKSHCTKIREGIRVNGTTSGERAIWELFQNARDLSKSAEIKITLTKKEFVFAHKGNAFTYDSLCSLVKQVSSRENKKTELLDFIMRRLSTIGGAPGVASMSDREVLASKIVTVEQLARNV